MKIKYMIATLALIVSPTLAFAECSGHSEKTASSCIDGYVWSADSQSCVEQKTS